MSNYSLIAWFYRSNRSVATIASMVTVCFGMMILAPTVAAANTALENAANETLIAGSEERQLSTAIAKVKRTLEKLEGKLDKNEDGTLEKNELKQLENSVRQLDQTVSQRFSQIAQHIQAKNLDPVIQQRHADMVSTYRTEFDNLVGNLANLDSTDAAVVSQAVQASLTQLNEFMLERPHQPIVPGQFSNFTMEPDFNIQPKETQDAYVQAGYVSSPQNVTTLAVNDDDTFTSLVGETDPAYLGETDEVRITDAIRAKALELDNDPVKIYYWVRNNVEWLPTWGAIQDADITLGSRRGNSIDIASLLIALYRASGIPSRYVHGAIEVPVDKFNNWTGNFTDTQAALSFASSGGIPLRQFTLTNGTTSTTTVRMEHVWVEAALDYFPSRAAIIKEADSWVKLDASFKQYHKLESIDAIEISGLDINQVTQDFIDSGTVNEAEGWVQGFDPTIIQTAQTQVQTSLEDYIENQLQNPTVGDVIGGRRTIIQEYPTIPSNTEAKILATGAKFAQVPDQLAPTITFAFSTDILGYPNDPITYRWSRLNNRKVTLSFRPATQADEDVLNSLIPADADGPEDLPSSIPSYLIKVLPELKIEGVTVKTGSLKTLGEELLLYNEIREPNRPVFRDKRSIIVGSFVSFAVVGGSVSNSRMRDLESSVSGTVSKLELATQQSLSSLTNDDILGDVFYGGVLGYFAQYIAMGELFTSQLGGRFGLPLSAGVFAYEPIVSVFFGIPRAIEHGWAGMDLHRVGRNMSTPDQPGIEGARARFQVGLLSSFLESSIPEQMFTSPEYPGEAVSAVKALEIARNEGQKIYNITTNNLSDVLPELNLSSEIEREISLYVNSGYKALAHSQNISVPGWRGAGYVLYDESTGAASWKVSGGKNGSFLPLLANIVFGALLIVAIGLILGNPIILGIEGIWLGTLIFASLALDFIVLMDSLDCTATGAISIFILIALAAAIVPFFASLLVVMFLPIAAFIYMNAIRALGSQACRLFTSV